ncbi:hypothetical protein SAMN04488109_1948 [Chryseolinea serpens]|uniref:Uncharacterized protein n=1 Tax=Chryseolinea serpens TaxID=947013 RepID=A0A1M5MW57_9BACT|nr:hypothetical protein [Chryseolinea serpens]SHG80993.1 hypothetical protein SAMN04488109_1948 [Chryseolinea serpens]
MKHLLNPIAVSLCMLAVTGCTPKTTTQESAVDSVATVPAVEAAEPEAMPRVEIRYGGAVRDEVLASLETLPMLSDVEALFGQSIRVKDSLYEAVGMNGIEKDPNNGELIKSAVGKAYEGILAYQNSLSDGLPKLDGCPDLFQLTRVPEPDDSSLLRLPEVKASQAFEHNGFFFLGGAPFVSKRPAPEGAGFADPSGNPETRFVAGITENTSYLLKSMFYYKQARAHVTFGPPLNAYEGSAHEVNGVGSLIHEFDGRIPALFLTEKGIVPAYLVSVEVKLSEEYGCISSLPQSEFACSTDLAESDILGIYIAYKSTSFPSCTLTRHGGVWTADLNGDAIPDLACVSGVFSGAASDTMAEALWFVNDKGEWKIIDWGREVDCT